MWYNDSVSYCCHGYQSTGVTLSRDFADEQVRLLVLSLFCVTTHNWEERGGKGGGKWGGGREREVVTG